MDSKTNNDFCEPLDAQTVKITFVGDIMCQGPMLESYRTDNGWDFLSIFRDIKPLLNESDFVFGNLETPIAPDDCDLTYKRWEFCSPKSFAEALKAAGIDFVFTANNHCLDRGVDGVKRTIEALDLVGLPHTGTFSTKEAAQSPTIVDVKGFKIALHSYTYGTNAFSNGQYLDESTSWMVNLFQQQELSPCGSREWIFGEKDSPKAKAYVEWEKGHFPDNFSLPIYERQEPNECERAKIRADVSRAKELKPDFTVLSMHTGGQYNPEATKYTKELKDFLFESGVDIVAGTHEHVVHGSDVSGIVENRIATYSLGNFDSLNGVWGDPFGKMADYSIAWHLYLTKDSNGNAHILKTTYSILKCVKEETTNRISVIPTNELYMRISDGGERIRLRNDIEKIVKDFSGLMVDKFTVRGEYLLAENDGIKEDEYCVDSNVPSGNIIVHKTGKDSVSVSEDLRDTTGGWFYWAFRVTGAAGRKLTFNFRGSYDGQVVGRRGPVVSLDKGKSWSYPLDGITSLRDFTYEFPQGADEVWFYECHPYTQDDWEAFLMRHSSQKGRYFETGVLCKSKKGRNVEKARFGCLEGAKHTMLLSSRHHASESVATYALEGFLEAVLAHDNVGEWFRNNVDVMVVPFMDKDGVVDGDQGKCRNPHDHNRDYSEFLYNETKATTEWIKEHTDNNLEIWLDLHCPWIRGLYNEYVYSPLKRNVNNHNEKSEVCFDKILETVQCGSLSYKAEDDLPYGTAWNSGGNYNDGWSSIYWAVNSLANLKLGHTFEIPFATANGAVVTPEKVRDLGRDIAKSVMLFLGRNNAEGNEQRAGNCHAVTDLTSSY